MTRTPLPGPREGKKKKKRKRENNRKQKKKKNNQTGLGGSPFRGKQDYFPKKKKKNFVFLTNVVSSLLEMVAF